MAYIFEETGKYPLFIGDIQLLYPEASEDNLPEGFYLVTESDRPISSETHVAVETSPELIDNVWVQRWSVRERTEEEIAEREETAQQRMQSVTSLDIV